MVHSGSGYPVALTIAGSDSGGGAGVQTDLRTFNAFGVYGCSVITAVTAQNPYEVMRIDEMPPESVTAQMDAVCSRFRVGYAKTGMLANAGIIESVADTVKKYGLDLVVDPVMVSTSGRLLLARDAVAVMRDKLLPLAKWITPNLPEAEYLLDGDKIDSYEKCRSAAVRLHDMCGASVLLKTGHADFDTGLACDIVCRGNSVYRLSSPRLELNSPVVSHGTGCTLSAALAAASAIKMPWRSAVCEAKAFVLGSLSELVDVGKKISAMYPPVEDYFESVKLDKF